MNQQQFSTSTSSTLGQMYRQVRHTHTSPQWSGVVLVSELNKWQIDTIKKLLQLLALPPDWDSYGSLPPSEIPVRAAVRLVLGIDLDYLAPPHVVPVSGGGVHLEWSFDSRELEIEINDEGAAEYLKSHHGKPIEEGQISLADFPRIRALLTWSIT